jgi:phospholipase C
MAIEHFFVLMLENRSFDHLFGFSPIKGPDAVTGELTTIDGVDRAHQQNADSSTGKVYAVHEPAEFSLKDLDIDPGHEFGDVAEQLVGPNQGFVNNHTNQPVKAADPGRVMDCFSSAQLPVLNQLASEFVICDRWFSALPGPTWPNRFFMMAATSGGLTKSPTAGDIIKATAFEGYSFEHGNIFDALDRKAIPWRIIEGDLFPISFALKGMNSNASKGRFIDIGNLAATLQDPAFNEKFIFIEPQYGTHKFDATGPGDYSGGNSMHPLDDIRKGEQLIKEVYDTIRSVAAVWEKSVLLITFDEHGGFYDHLTPPAATPPSDTPVNVASGQEPFGFDKLGVRVPALVVSPWVGKGLIDHTVYDHTSALATLERLFGVPSLTKRDAKAQDFRHLFSLDQPRTDAPVTLVSPAWAVASEGIGATAPEGVAVPPEGVTMPPEALAVKAQDMRAPLEGTQDTRESLKTELASVEARPEGEELAVELPVSGPQVTFAYVGLMRALGQADTEEEKEAWKKEFSEIHTRKDAARLMTRAKLKVGFGEYVPKIG